MSFRNLPTDSRSAKSSSPEMSHHRQRRSRSRMEVHMSPNQVSRDPQRSHSRLDALTLQLDNSAARLAHSEAQRRDLASRHAQQAQQSSAQVSRTSEELNLYKIQLERANAEILRAQQMLRLVEGQRDEAERSATHARSVARRLAEEHAILKATERGVKEGYQMGLARAVADRHGKSSKHTTKHTESKVHTSSRSRRQKHSDSARHSLASYAPPNPLAVAPATEPIDAPKSSIVPQVVTAPLPPPAPQVPMSVSSASIPQVVPVTHGVVPASASQTKVLPPQFPMHVSRGVQSQETIVQHDTSPKQRAAQPSHEALPPREMHFSRQFQSSPPYDSQSQSSSSSGAVDSPTPPKASTTFTRSVDRTISDGSETLVGTSSVSTKRVKASGPSQGLKPLLRFGKVPEVRRAPVSTVDVYRVQVPPKSASESQAPGKHAAKSEPRFLEQTPSHSTANEEPRQFRGAMPFPEIKHAVPAPQPASVPRVEEVRQTLRTVPEVVRSEMRQGPVPSVVDAALPLPVPPPPVPVLFTPRYVPMPLPPVGVAPRSSGPPSSATHHMPRHSRSQSVPQAISANAYDNVRPQPTHHASQSSQSWLPEFEVERAGPSSQRASTSGSATQAERQRHRRATLDMPVYMPAPPLERRAEGRLRPSAQASGPVPSIRVPVIPAVVVTTPSPTDVRAYAAHGTGGSRSHQQSLHAIPEVVPQTPARTSNSGGQSVHDTLLSPGDRPTPIIRWVIREPGEENHDVATEPNDVEDNYNPRNPLTPSTYEDFEHVKSWQNDVARSNDQAGRVPAGRSESLSPNVALRNTNSSDDDPSGPSSAASSVYTIHIEPPSRPESIDDTVIVETNGLLSPNHAGMYAAPLPPDTAQRSMPQHNNRPPPALSPSTSRTMPAKPSLVPSSHYDPGSRGVVTAGGVRFTEKPMEPVANEEQASTRQRETYAVAPTPPGFVYPLPPGVTSASTSYTTPSTPTAYMANTVAPATPIYGGGQLRTPPNQRGPVIPAYIPPHHLESPGSSDRDSIDSDAQDPTTLRNTRANAIPH
ncbi:hypothetical protein FISHEDRAFT_77805 [Fistulina hepatica ATCC 64428]|nr:hypothetical protein FISHEDRAFT_77805 [Fistulina hepatica ATCC 64428]